MAESPIAELTPLKCTTCGRPLRLPAQLQRGDGMVVVECPIDGLFQVGTNTVLKPQSPWKALVFWVIVFVVGVVIWLVSGRMARP